jgi:predicted DNA-binding protein (MmcQ/YjbR family)
VVRALDEIRKSAAISGPPARTAPEYVPRPSICLRAAGDFAESSQFVRAWKGIGWLRVPDLDDLAEQLRELALSLPETYEDDPWGHPVFKVAENRMFASMSVGDDAVRLTVKLTPEEREIAHLLPYVSTARYVGRYGWVTAAVADDESLEAALEWLRESYWLKAPPHLRAAVEGE